MRPIQTGVLWILSTCAALLATNAIADIPSAANECVSGLVETTPSSDFTALEGGAVVRHEPTGLEWRRCAEGMDWTGAGCTGDAGIWRWQEALQYADEVSGWRLPNIKELQSIIELCRRHPAVNQQVFSDLPLSVIQLFWSSTPTLLFGDFAGTQKQAVNFRSGRYGAELGPARLLLVRDGQ